METRANYIWVGAVTLALLAALGLSDKANAYVRALSGGMKRRLMVAKALVHAPPVLILDEPTAGVDVELRRQLWDYVRRLNAEGVTILLTTHYLEEAQELCDTIAIVNRGQVVACEPTPQLLRRLDTRNVVVSPETPLKAPPVLDGFEVTPRSGGAFSVTYRKGRSSVEQVLAAVRAAGGRHVILRTSWVVSAHGANFVKTMLRLGAERDRLTIVADQVGGPTPAADIAQACLEIAGQLIADPGKSGTYHFSGGPDVSWADFAREIFAQAGLSPEVADIPTTDFPTPAKRPLNSRLDNGALTATFGIARPDWRAGLKDILADIGASK